MMSPQRAVGPFYTVQAAAVAAWWATLLLWPAARPPFMPHGLEWPLLLAFVWPDVLILVVGSLIAAVTRAGGLRLLLLGAVAYPTLLCLAWSATVGGGHAAALAMTLMLMLVANAAICAELRLFRITRAATPNRHLIVTLAQVAPFWLTFLVVLPWLISACDPLRTTPPSWLGMLATATFIAASALGLASSVCMARRGLGTPLPVACPALLVVSGPYAHVRNPMALAGCIQGLAVAAIMGSPAVAAYALAGAVVWHLVARPSEEG
ncbi:MAG: isoprenylcysteine carboxylmethyltransferase family protein, partial [Planctomycetes bacterium]|nr:isoprenylcysteine carboxylmethyltransferase family protein [Planctomycetota bacterium]